MYDLRLVRIVIFSLVVFKPDSRARGPEFEFVYLTVIHRKDVDVS